MIEIVDPYGFIYITTNMINGKRYIGQRKFYGNWKEYLGSGILLTRAIKKHGKENFIRNIIAISYSEEEINTLEKIWIENYDAVKSDSFYNIADGGFAGNTYAGKTEEEMNIIKTKISIANKGENNVLYGKHHSDKTKRKISEATKGKIVTEETKKKMSKNTKGSNNPMAKEVICLNTLKKFCCAKDGAEYYNLYNSGGSGIIKCCKNHTYSCGHLEDDMPLVWMYYSDYMKLKEKEITYKINYAINKIKTFNKKRVICTTTDEVFECIKDGGKYYNIQNYGGITNCCKGNYQYCGMLEDGTRLQWKYYEDCCKYNKKERHKKINDINREIICVTTNKIFKSASMASKEYFTKSRAYHIVCCCKNERNYCGKLLDGSPLKWMYYDEYIKRSQQLIHNEKLVQAI